MSLVIMVCGRYGRGHHGNCLWPSWFVAITVESPQIHSLLVVLQMPVQLAMQRLYSLPLTAKLTL